MATSYQVDVKIDFMRRTIVLAFLGPEGPAFAASYRAQALAKLPYGPDKFVALDMPPDLDCVFASSEHDGLLLHFLEETTAREWEDVMFCADPVSPRRLYIKRHWDLGELHTALDPRRVNTALVSPSSEPYIRPAQHSETLESNSPQPFFR